MRLVANHCDRCKLINMAVYEVICKRIYSAGGFGDASVDSCSYINFDNLLGDDC